MWYFSIADSTETICATILHLSLATSNARKSNGQLQAKLGLKQKIFSHEK